MTNNRPIVDPQQVACLGGGSHAVVAIGPDGENLLWIMGPEPSDQTHGCACPDHAPHEQDGPLPPVYRHRLNSILLRCGAPTFSTGQPCRTPVAQPGQRCGHHRHQTDRNQETH